MNTSSTQKIKVSDMTKIKTVNNDSLFLVVQNGVGHRISFSDLKAMILEELKKEIKELSTELKDVQKQHLLDKQQQKHTLQDALDEFQKNMVISARNSLTSLKSNIVGIVENYHEDAEKQFGKFKTDINADNIPKLFSKNTELQRRMTRTENSLSQKISTEISANVSKLEKMIEQKIDATSELSKANISLTEQLSCQLDTTLNSTADLSSYLSEFETNVKQQLVDIEKSAKKQYSDLSSAIDEVDASVNGVIVEDVDVDTARVSSRLVREGTISKLSAQIAELSSMMMKVK